MQYKVLFEKGVLQYHDRDIVLVDAGDHIQPFYRSTGRNSGQLGTWFPFDNIRPEDGWVNKAAYCHGVPDGLVRYGTEENRFISGLLAGLHITAGEIASIAKINRWILMAKHNKTKSTSKSSTSA